MSGPVTIPGAILRATRPGEKGVFGQVCGVFGPDRAPVAAARTTARVGALSLPCACPKPEALPRRAGRWLFGGIAFHHFGHALIFSTSRLWALDHLDRAPDGLLFFDRGTRGATRTGVTRNLAAMLDALGIDLPVVTVARDESVETLIVPQEGISTADDLFCGTDRFRRFIRQRMGRVPPIPAGGDIFLSRRGLGAHHPGLLFEDVVEAQMAAAGYRVFHPQRAALATQIATYRGAARIVAADSSALHLVAFAAQPGTRVAVLGRRPVFPEAFARQIAAIGGAEATVIAATSAVYADARQAGSALPWLASYALPDLPRMARGLVEAGFLPQGTLWPDPGPDRLRDRLAAIARHIGAGLVALPPTVADAGPLPLAPRPPSA
jgi:hypothetical protein